MKAKTGSGEALAVLGNQYRIHSGFAGIEIDLHICCGGEKWIYYNKNERMIEMSVATEGYSDLVQRIEGEFMEIDNDILVDLRKQDKSYLELCRQIGDMEKDYLFILDVTEGEGNITLTEEEHRVLVEYFRLNLKKDNIERKQIYFRGHTDGYAYLKKIGAV